MNLPNTHINSKPWLDILFGLGIFLAFLILYTSTAAQGFIIGGGAESESVELQRAVVHNGIAHATTYPVYVISAHYFTRLGAFLGGDPFSWATYFSSFTTALSLVVVYTLLRIWVGRSASLVAAIIFGLSGAVWHIATITEVQGLHLLTFVAILYLLACYQRHPEKVAYLEGMALLLGIGLANHRLIVLIGPAALAVFLFKRGWRWLNLWQVVRFAAMVALPLLAYYDVFFKVPAGVVYGFGTTLNPPVSPYNALEIVFGYGQDGLLRLPMAELPARLSFVLGHHLEDFTWPGTALGVVGFCLFARRNPLYAFALLAYGAASLVFFMAWRQDQKAFIYYGTTGLLLAIGLAALADVTLPNLKALPTLLLRLRLAPVVALLAVPIALTQYPQQNRAADNSGAQLFHAYSTLPNNAVVFTGGWSPDHWIGLEAQDRGGLFTLNYVRDVEEIYRYTTDGALRTYVSRWMQQFLGMWSGKNPLLDRGLAFGAGPAPQFVEVMQANFDGPAKEAETATRLNQSIGQNIVLYSYKITQQTDKVTFTLYWRTEAAPDVRLQPFAHLRVVDVNGVATALLAQGDTADPVYGFFPTTAWRANQTIRDSYTIHLPQNMPTAESLRWVFGFTLNGERIGEASLPFEVILK
jgi:Protein of unknown function (DUF2723)